MKRISILVILLALFAFLGTQAHAATTVPGHSVDGKNSARIDRDNNGISDAGVYVNGHYTSLYAYDVSGDYYWDLGDGRVYKTVPTLEDLDQTTLTTCNYVINYRADFGNTPYMDAGWIQNIIDCSGYDDNGHYNYFIVHESDPRYEGNPDWAVWETWEYHVLTESKSGNLVRPMNHVGN